MSRRTELEPLARELMEIIQEEFDGKADPEDINVIRLAVSIMSDAYDFGRQAEAREFLAIAKNRHTMWEETTHSART